MDLEKRFWKYVQKTQDCWIWIGATRGKSGYGTLKVSGKSQGSHRISWLIHFGEIPKAMCVCHHCDNRLCVKPDHLFLGTQRDNIMDAVRKGRQVPPVPTKCYNGKHWTTTKLTWKIVQKMRKEYKMGKTTYRKLSKKYGVCYNTIEHVIRNMTWVNASMV